MYFWIGLAIIVILYFGAGALCIWKNNYRILKVIEDTYWAVLGLWYILYGLFFTETVFALRLYTLSGCGFFFISIMWLVHHWLQAWKEN